MRYSKILGIAGIAAAVAFGTLLSGCGQARPDLSYDHSAQAPVIIYAETSVISPLYNPDVPVVVVYGDGRVISKGGPYQLTTASLQGSVDDLLGTLANEGFFGLKDVYEGEPLAGGTTSVLKVNLQSGECEATVRDQRSQPARWQDMVNTVKNATTVGAAEYIPARITLFAGIATDIPVSVTSLPWPGGAQDLVNAANNPGTGTVVEGGGAAAAWAAIRQGEQIMETRHEADVYWQAGGTIYTFVYAHPELPGMVES